MSKRALPSRVRDGDSRGTRAKRTSSGRWVLRLSSPLDGAFLCWMGTPETLEILWSCLARLREITRVSWLEFKP